MSDYPNTVTSPSEEDALATGNEQGPSPAPPPPRPVAAPSSPLPPQPAPSSDGGMRVFRDRTPKPMLPMEKIMAAVMRGAAQVQGQEQAKTVAKSQAAAKPPTITLKASPDGGPPLVTVKDIGVDQLNGTQASDIQQAYDTPRQQVEAKIGGKAAPEAQQQAPTTHPGDEHPMEQAFQSIDSAQGYRQARPWDTDIAEKLKSEEGIRSLQQEVGSPNASAHARQTWKSLQAGRITPEQVAQRVANFRLQKGVEKSKGIESALLPAEREADRKQIERDRQETEARLQRTQTDSENKRALDEKLNFLKGTDLSLTLPEDLEKTINAATSTPWTSYETNRARIKQQQDVNKAFEDYTDTKKETFALGNQPTWEAAKTAFGHPLTQQQDTIGKARWQAARAYTVRKANDDTAQQELRAARLEAIQAKLATAGQDKPLQIGRADLDLMPASEVAGMDPQKVKNYDSALEQKAGLLHREIERESDKFTAASGEAQAAQKEMDAGQKFGVQERLANHRATMQISMRKVQAAKAELQVIQQMRDQRLGIARPAPKKAAAKPDPLGIR